MNNSRKRSIHGPAAKDLGEFLSSRTLTFHTGWSHEVSTPYCEFHSHSSYELVFHARGSGVTCIAGGRKISYDEGSVIIYPPNAEHDQTHSVPTTDVCIHFGPCDVLFRQISDCFHLNALADSLLIDEIAFLARPWPDQTAMEKVLFNQRISAVVAALCSIRQSGPGEPASGYAAQAVDFMKRNLETITDIAQVARPLGISAEYLRHTFRQYQGIGIKQWLTRARLERARNLLLHSTLPLKSIAGACGFGTDRYFCSVFKTGMGCTPGEFRTTKRLGHEIAPQSANAGIPASYP